MMSVVSVPGDTATTDSDRAVASDLPLRQGISNNGPMQVDPETAAIAVVSLFGAGAVAVVTRRYEPPPREGEDDPPEPVFESGVFAALSGGLFVGLGYALATVGRWGALGQTATLLLSLVGLYSAYTTYTGRIADDADQATALIGVISATVLGVYPPLFFALSAL